jgi:hypothetical protein
VQECEGEVRRLQAEVALKAAALAEAATGREALATQLTQQKLATSREVGPPRKYWMLLVGSSA